MNRKLLRGLVFDCRSRGDRTPQRSRYLVEPIAHAGNISHVLRLLFSIIQSLSSAHHRPMMIVDCRPSSARIISRTAQRHESARRPVAGWWAVVTRCSINP